MQKCFPLIEEWRRLEGTLDEKYRVMANFVRKLSEVFVINWSCYQLFWCIQFKQLWDQMKVDVLKLYHENGWEIESLTCILTFDRKYSLIEPKNCLKNNLNYKWKQHLSAVSFFLESLSKFKYRFIENKGKQGHLNLRTKEKLDIQYELVKLTKFYLVLKNFKFQMRNTQYTSKQAENFCFLIKIVTTLLPWKNSSKGSETLKKLSSSATVSKNKSSVSLSALASMYFDKIVAIRSIGT